jgi:LemA protein
VPNGLPPHAAPRPRRGLRATPLVVLAALFLGSGALYWLLVAGDGPAPIENVAETLNQVGATGAMNGSLQRIIGLSLFGLPLVLPLVWLVWLYNGIVDKEEQVYGAWAQVESNYQRRSDLIPNLVAMVDRYLDHERDTSIGVAAERGAALNPIMAALKDVDTARKTAEQLAGEAEPEAPAEAALARLAAAQEAVGQSLGRFFGVVENYPQLRSADQFLELQAQLEGSENRINVARLEFNRAVEDYNGAIRRLPGSLVARVGDFGRKAYFQAAEGAAEAAELAFD